MLPTTKQQKLLAFGYVRLFTLIHIPITLINIMLRYFNDIDNINMNFNKFSIHKSFEKFYTPFWINKIKFQCLIRINHFLHSKFVLLSVRVTSPYKMNQVTWYLEFNCAETKSYIKGTKRIMLNNLKNREWTIPVVQLTKVKKKNVNFSLYIHIKQIHIKSKDRLLILYDRINTQQSVTFHWEFTKDLMTEIKNKNIDGSRKYYSPNFGNYNTWYLKFRPDQAHTYITLLHGSFPPNIKNITVKYFITLTLDEKRYPKKTSQTFTRYDMGTELRCVDIDWTQIVSAYKISVWCHINKFV